MCMELYEANKILRSVKAAFTASGGKLPSSCETDGLMMLLGKLDAEKYLAPKIRHAQTLTKNVSAYDRACIQISFFRALMLSSVGLQNPVTAMSLMLLHKNLFGDMNKDAGKLRTKDAFTEGSAHTDPKYIAGSLKSIITKMNEMGSAPLASRDDFAGYLSHYMRELVILHPFDNGSELAVRVFIMLFCKQKGFALSYHRIAPSVIADSEKQAFAADNVAPLYTMFAECLSYDHKTIKPQPSSPPRTRREAAKDLTRKPAPQQTATAEQPQEQKHKNKSGLSDDEVLKRAIRLQQKISKLNEQLTELIGPLENKNPK